MLEHYYLDRAIGGTQWRGKGKLLSELEAEWISLRSHPFDEQEYHEQADDGT